MTTLVIALLLATPPAQPIQVGAPDPASRPIVTPLPPRPYSVPDELDWLESELTPLAASSAPDRGSSQVDYETELARALLFSETRVLQMVVAPAFDPPEAVYVELRRGECRVVSTRLTGSLSFALGLGAPPRDDPMPIPMATLATAPLPSAACEAVRSAWDSALRAAKSPQAPYLIAADGQRVDVAPLDGTTYHFADSNVHWPPQLERLLSSCDLRGASAHSPREGTRLADLVGLGRLLAAYARAPGDRRDALASELATVASRVRDRFERDRARDPELARKERFEAAMLQRLDVKAPAAPDLAVTATRYMSSASLPATDPGVADSKRRERGLRDGPVWVVTVSPRCPGLSVGGGSWAIFDEQSERLLAGGTVR